MAGEKIDFDQVKESAAASDKRAESTISFPNYDLDAGISVTKNVYARSGLGPCPLDELAAEAGTTMSGNFRNKNSAARLFGFIEKDGQSKVKLTDLGARVLSGETEAEARATAFLNVPLYQQIYEKYRGKLLPPAKALEREMVTLGVIPSMSATARQIFQRSAKEAGFFNSGEDRLVRPRINGGAPAETVDQVIADSPPPSKEPEAPRRGGGSGGGTGDNLHPFVRGLLETLPAPDTEWDEAKRAEWLQAAASIFKLIYKSNGNGTIEVKVT